MIHIRRTSDTNSGMTDDFRTGSIRVASRISLIIVPEQWVKKCSNNSNMGVSQAERYGICGAIDTMVKSGLLGLGVVVVQHRLRHAKGLTRWSSILH